MIGTTEEARASMVLKKNKTKKGKQGSQSSVEFVSLIHKEKLTQGNGKRQRMNFEWIDPKAKAKGW